MHLNAGTATNFKIRFSFLSCASIRSAIALVFSDYIFMAGRISLIDFFNHYFFPELPIKLPTL